MPRLLMVAGTQHTTSDLHLLYLRAFEKIGFEATLLAHDSGLPFTEKVLQQGRLQLSSAHFSLVNRRVRLAALALRPDLVVVSGSNWYLLPETLREVKRRLGCRVVLNEQHLQVFRSHQAGALEVYDHVFTQDSALVPLLRAASPARKVSLLGPACDPVEHRPVALTDEERAHLGSDLAYVGWAYPNRLRLFEDLAEFDLRLWGMGWDASPVLRGRFRDEPVHGLKKTKIYNAARILLNLQSTTYQIDGVTCRPFEVAACGGFCLSEPKKDLAAFFVPGEEMVTFQDAADLKKKAAYYLAHEDERRAIAARARARALREHTYEHRAREVAAAVGMA
jgi:spore maturation protein CgeB